MQRRILVLRITPDDSKRVYIDLKFRIVIAPAIFFRAMIDTVAIDARTSAAAEIIIPKGEAASRAIDTENRQANQGSAITFALILMRRLLNLFDGRTRHAASGVK